MRLVPEFVLVVALALGGAACSSGSGGGSVSSDAALQGFMQTIALDFAQVLADVAPNFDALSAKGGGGTTTQCPEGGTATWNVTTGTLGLSECQMRGIAVSGNLVGFLDSYLDSVSATMMRGPITTSGAFSGDLNITDLIVSAQLPIADETTFWQVTATDTGGEMLCAWSGGSGCGPSQF